MRGNLFQRGHFRQRQRDRFVVSAEFVPHGRLDHPPNILEGTVRVRLQFRAHIVRFDLPQVGAQAIQQGVMRVGAKVRAQLTFDLRRAEVICGDYVRFVVSERREYPFARGHHGFSPIQQPPPGRGFCSLVSRTAQGTAGGR